MWMIRMSKIRVVVSVAIFSLLSGCATKNVSFGDLVLQESGQIGAIGKKWDEGNAMLSKGRRQIKKGESQIEEGHLNVRQGKKKVKQGQRLIDEATKAYEVRQSKVLLSN